MVSPVSSISIACFGLMIARQRHHRRRAEQADIDARRAEGRLLRGDGEVAGGDELASGGRGEPATSAITGCGWRTIACISSAQRRIVASKKARPPSASARWAVISFRSCPAENTRPVGGDDHHPALRIVRRLRQRRHQRVHHRHRQRVRRRARQADAVHAAQPLDRDGWA